SLKEKLIKIGAKVVSHGRYVVFQMAEVAKCSRRFCGSSRNCGRSHHQRQHETFYTHAFKSNRRNECVRMPRKTARSGSQTPLGRRECREPSTLSHLGFPTSSENGYHPRQFRIHLGNPGSIVFSSNLPRTQFGTRSASIRGRDAATLNQRTGFAAVLWSSCLAMLAVGANGTAIMAALPSMRTELGLSSAGVEWAVNAYLVVSAAFIVFGGQAADRFGARPAAVAGLALFAVASCIIANAATQAELLAGRALQGFAAAVAVPSTLAAVNTSAASERRAAAIGAWTGFLMLGFSIGPLFGGALTHFTGWRVIFWFNVALMLTAIAGLASTRLDTARADATQGRRADWIGFVLLTTFMVSLVFGLHALPHARAAPLPAVGPFVLAAAAFFLLLIVESRAKPPLVDL